MVATQCTKNDETLLYTMLKVHNIGVSGTFFKLAFSNIAVRTIQRNLVLISERRYQGENYCSCSYNNVLLDI